MKAPNNPLFDKFAKFCFSSYPNMLIGVLATTIVMMIPIVCLAFLILYTPSSTETSVVTTITSTTTTTCTTCTTSTTVTTVATTTDETTTSMTAITDITIITTTSVTTTTTTEYDPTSRLIDYGWFTGTYYNGETNPCPGGSGRILEDCTPKSGEMKGSVACRRIFEDYGYTVNGRTRVYLEFESYPEMNGWYFVDDCCQSMNVVDVYFIDYATCPWQNDGVTDIHLWMEVS